MASTVDAADAAPGRTGRPPIRNSGRLVKRLWLIALLMLLPAAALAAPTGIRVERAWSRAMPAGATLVVYPGMGHGTARGRSMGGAAPK